MYTLGTEGLGKIILLGMGGGVSMGLYDPKNLGYSWKISRTKPTTSKI